MPPSVSGTASINIWKRQPLATTQLTFTSFKPTKETLEKGVKYFQSSQ